LPWGPVWPALCEHALVIAPELPGIGEGSQGNPSGFAGYARWVVRVLNTLHVSAARVSGNSFGEALAWDLAAQSPERTFKRYVYSWREKKRKNAQSSRKSDEANGAARTYVHFTKQYRRFMMSKILSTATAVLMIAFATTGVAQARPINHQHPAGYAGPVYSQAPRAHPDGYDGSRYWWGGDCWPLKPGGCDW